VVAVVGTAATLGVGRMWVLQWVASGEKFPVGQWASVSIPDEARQTLVYYESDHSVGRRFMRLYIRDQYGEAYPTRVPTDDNEFSVAGRQGRALFRLNLDEAGVYDFRCDNPNYASDAEVPVTDRVVFLKSPNTRAEVLAVRRVILVTGGTSTVVAVLVLYVLHGLRLGRRQERARRAAAPSLVDAA
jgi:hypothetical protein